MARDEKRRQKGLARRKRREKERHQRDSRSHQTSGGDWATLALLRNARQFPIHECLISSTWDHEGLGQFLISRQPPDGRIAFGVYLVDRYCLGVKNAFCNIVSPETYEHVLKPKVLQDGRPSAVSAERFCQIIYAAIDYARRLGFQPDPGFALAQHLLEPRESVPPDTTTEFGQDGKPFYISGPHDNVQRILQTLDQNVGQGNYHFMVGGPA